MECLETLELSGIKDDEDGKVSRELNRLLENLNPLQELNLHGYFDDKCFATILSRHGASLRPLSISPERNENSFLHLTLFTEELVQLLAEHCPNLEEIHLPIARTRGDGQELGIYRALSRFPRMKRPSLKLWYSIGQYEDGREHQRLYSGRARRRPWVAEYIPLHHLRDAFSNSESTPASRDRSSTS